MAPPEPRSPVEKIKFPLFRAAYSGKLPELKRLVDEAKKLGKRIEDFADAGGQMAFHFAAGFGHLEVCEYIFEELKVDVDIKDKFGRTPLHHACTSKRVDVAEYLLQQGADPNMKSVFWRTPMHHAAEKGPKDLVELLLAKGAKVNAMASSGTPLQHAVSKGQDDIVELLLDDKADPNAMSLLKFYPLLDSIIGRDLKCMKLLLQAGADPNLCGSKGISALGEAAHQGWVEAIECLLERGADPNVTDISGMTPLETATLKGCLDGVKILFPATVSIPSIQDWSIDGVMNHADSREAKKERQWKLEQHFLLSKSKGAEAYNSSDYLGAIECYTEALYCKKEAAILSNLSACWAHLNEGGLALEEALMCIRIRPNWAKAHYRKGVALRMLKNFDEAASTFYKAFRMDPGNQYIERAYKEACSSSGIDPKELSSLHWFI